MAEPISSFVESSGRGPTTRRREKSCQWLRGLWSTRICWPATTRGCALSQRSGRPGMFDLLRTREGFLGPIARVVEAALRTTDELMPDHVMVVGAWCRDILHSA